MQLHGTHAFKEFLERKGYRKPEVSHGERNQSVFIINSTDQGCLSPENKTICPAARF